MKIIPEQILNNNRDVLRKQDAGKPGVKPEVAVKSSACDTITIEAKQDADVTDAQFIAQLKKSILSDIQAGAPEHKLDSLKRQIALNEYDVNIPEIIKKIMSAGPEVNYD